MNSRMSRRTFLRSALAVGAGAVLYRYSDGSYRIALANPNAGPEAYKLRIIHTNDHHARIEPVNITIKSSAPTAARDFGGVARRKTMFDQIRAEADGLDKLFLDAGDVFQGTLYFNEYEGQADLFFYNALGYHAMTLGNHEFDKGDKVLADFITGASFPVISANVSATGGDLQPLLVTGDDTANGKLGQRKIVTFGAEKIGIFGLTTPETPLLASPSAFVTFDENLAVVAQAQVDALKLAGCNKIIALTHLGYGVDIELAKATKGIDVIIGGHSHTPVLADSQQSWPLGVTRQGPYPTIEKDMDGNDVVVVTDWEWGKWVGDIVVGFDAAGLVTAVTGTSAVKPVWAGGLGTPPRALLPDEGAEIAPDAAFQAKIDTDYKPGIDALTKEVIGKTDILLDGARNNVRTRETNLSNLIADTMRLRILKEVDANPNKLPVVCITNGGGIRSDIKAGDITVGSVLTVLPFGNRLATVDVTGAQLKAALENGVSQVDSAAGPAGRFPQVSGLRFLWDPAGTAAKAASGSTPGVPGKRVLNIEILQVAPAASGLQADVYVPIDPAKTYRVVTNDFMLTGGDGYSVFTPAGDKADPSVGGGTNQLDTGLIMADEVQAYITAKTPIDAIDAPLEGRIMAIRAWLPFIYSAPANLGAY
jgi:5'-nucleotidase/UDP-sugar diphosphatase